MARRPPAAPAPFTTVPALWQGNDESCEARGLTRAKVLALTILVKVREIRIQNFRNFGPTPREVRFDDESTGLIRPLSVVVGSNGSGKSTIFQLIEGLLSYALEVVEDRPITHALREQGYAALRVEFDEDAPLGLREGIWIALGRKDRAPENYSSLPNQICHIEQRGGSGKPFKRAAIYHLRELAREHDLQIIITTHSLEIVSAVSPTEIINLDDMVALERDQEHEAAR
jgi:predicted ATP-dependent endonuclease of OLD family